MKKKTSSEGSTGGVQKVRRGFRVVEQSLFKLMVATAQRNESYKYKQPKLVGVEHCHFYRDVSEKNGMTNKYCVPVNGHFHEVTVDFSQSVTKEIRMPDGTISVFENQPLTICGPAMRQVKYYDDPMRPPVVEIQPIEFEGVRGDVQVDDHTHEIIYIETQDLSLQALEKLRSESRDAVRGQMSGPPVTQAARLQGMGTPSEETRGLLRDV